MADSRMRRMSKKQRAKIRRRKKRLRAAVVLFACALICFLFCQILLFFYVHRYAKDTALEGVRVGNLDVSGMTVSQVEKAVEKQVKACQNGTLTIKAGKSSGDTTYKKMGLSADGKNLAKEAVNYGKEGNLFKRFKEIRSCKKNGYTVPLQYTVNEKKTKKILKTVCANSYDGPVNASMVTKKGKPVITEGKEGEAVDVKATIKVIEKYLNDGWQGEDGTITAKSKMTKPEIQASDLKELSDVLGTFQTYYGDDGSSKAINVEAGANHIGGHLVKPGEEFSANAAMEPYTEENGYTEGGSYENGQVVQTMGGGICQVSTTLYNALLLAEVEITERMPHSMLIDYVEPSMDAAIADDVKDLKFKNNYKTPIYIESVLSDGYLTFNIYGKETRDKNRTIEYVSETLDTEEAEGTRFVETDEYVGYYEVISGAREGLSAQLWKVVYENGEEVSRDVVNTSHYASSPMTIGVGANTSNSALKSRIESAIASQDKDTILSAIGGGSYDGDEDY